MRGLSALGFLLATVCAVAMEAPRAVVLVTLDTTRADHLGCYGYTRPTSPFLDRLARDGILFENALAAMPHTSPSHATLFTGHRGFHYVDLGGYRGVYRPADETVSRVLDWLRRPPPRGRLFL